MVSATACRPAPAGPLFKPVASRAVTGSPPEPGTTPPSPSELVASRPSRPWRIRDRTTFADLRRSGRRIKRGPVTVIWIDGDPYQPPRVAYAVGRSVGNAVQRNRLRRRLRAIVSDRAGAWRPGAYLIGASPPATFLSWGELRGIVNEALDAIGQPDPPAPRAGHA
jgi:ribonuclease P protein component